MLSRCIREYEIDFEVIYINFHLSKLLVFYYFMFIYILFYFNYNARKYE